MLKEKTSIIPPNLSFGFCRLEFQDVGPYADPVLRQGIAKFASPAFSAVTGISGSPVYDLTAQALCGMVIRGGMSGDLCRIYYMDIRDIVRLLEAAAEEAQSVYYTKAVRV